MIKSQSLGGNIQKDRELLFCLCKFDNSQRFCMKYGRDVDSLLQTAHLLSGKRQVLETEVSRREHRLQIAPTLAGFQSLANFLSSLRALESSCFSLNPGRVTLADPTSPSLKSSRLYNGDDINSASFRRSP